MTTELKGAHRSIRGHLIFGLTLILVLAVGFGGWAPTPIKIVSEAGAAKKS